MWAGVRVGDAGATNDTRSATVAVNISVSLSYSLSRSISPIAMPTQMNSIKYKIYSYVRVLGTFSIGFYVQNINKRNVTHN